MQITSKPKFSGWQHSFVRWRFQLMLFVVALLVSGCSYTPKPQLPSISPDADGQYQVGKFVWFDLITEDIQSVRAFYSDLFGWEITPSPEVPDYLLINLSGQQIGGILPLDEQDKTIPESLWIGSLSVSDVDKAASQVNVHGGKVLNGPLDVGARGRVAVVEDPAGAKFVLLKSRQGDPDHGALSVNSWLWVDLFTNDYQSAAKFYQAVASYEFEEVNKGKTSRYHVLKKDQKKIAGVVELWSTDVKANWLPYVQVDNLSVIIKKAVSAGGTLLLRTDDVAILTDPAGAAFGVQQILKGGAS